MKKGFFTYIIFCFALVMFVSCGPSPEAIATMTAAAWTPTPEPTLTPTPMPFDLEVRVEGEAGESVTYGAYVATTGHEEVMLEDSGMVELLNLPGPEVEVSVRAQGYKPYTETVNLEHGKNQTTLSLTADPLQVNPATACQEGQKILFIEDFEDGEAQGWNDLARPAWSFGKSEEFGTNLSVYVPGEVGSTNFPGEFANAVWHFSLQTGANPIDLHINWHTFENEEGGGRYFLVYDPNRHIQLHYMKPGEGRELYSKGGALGEPNIWQDISFAFFDGALDAYINDELIAGVNHENGIESGGLGFIVTDNSEPIAFDNMVVCELNSPYTPTVVEEAVE